MGTPGLWQDHGTVACQGAMLAGPYGSVTFAGGVAIFEGGPSRAFPCVFAGQPSRPSPFPRTGDVILKLRRATYKNLGGRKK